MVVLVVGVCRKGAGGRMVAGYCFFPLSKDSFSPLRMPSFLGLWCLCNEKLFLALFCQAHFHFVLTYSLGNNCKMIQVCLWQSNSHHSEFLNIGTWSTLKAKDSHQRTVLFKTRMWISSLPKGSLLVGLSFVLVVMGQRFQYLKLPTIHICISW